MITAQLAIVNANQTLATGGSAQAATDARDAALVLLQLINARVRFFYCQASDDTDRSAELVSIGRQPRRDAGTATTQPLPDAPDEVTFDEMTLTLSVAELAGTSSTTTVGLTDLGPLTPGVSYEFWLVGHNSRGDGPESEHVTHVAV